MFAIVGLLWSHLALAGHSACVSMATVLADSHLTAVGESAGHDDPAASAEGAVCDTHCTQGDRSSDTPRAPMPCPLSLGPAPALIATAAILPASAQPIGWRPPMPWHRPTAHPASILLI